MRRIAAVVAVLVVLAFWVLAGRDAERVYDEGPVALADGVAAWVESGQHSGAKTGSPLFDAEWAFVTCQMAVLGLVPMIEQRPDRIDDWKPAADECMARLMTPEARSFGTAAWRADGFDATRGHAYLGYLNLALRVYGRIDDRYAAEHDALSAMFRRQVEQRDWIIETYPGEIYPPDIAAVAGSIGDTDGFERFVDPTTGRLYQAVDSAGRPVDGPRGSGTAIAAFFVSHADPRLSAELYAALDVDDYAGMGVVREHHSGDVDSGPVLFGYGVSATGFALAGARMHGDRDAFVAISRTATLFGMPLTPGPRGYLTGGPVGNAILLAMMAADS